MLDVNQLIGFGSRRRPAPVSTLTFISSNGVIGTSITAPTVSPGDLLLVYNAARTNAGPAPALAIPSGFTSIVDVSDGTTARAAWSYKICVGNEDGSSLGGMTGVNVNRIGYALFRGDQAVVMVSPQNLDSESTSGNPAAQVIAAAADIPPLVALAGYYASAAIDPRSFSPAEDGEQQCGATSAYFKYKIYNSSPSDITVDMDDEGDANTLTSFYLLVR